MQQTPQDLALPVQKLVTETVGVTMQKLVFSVGDSQTPSSVEVLLMPLDANGEWATGVQPIRLFKQDALFTQAEPIQAKIATLIQSLTLGATVRDDHPLVQAYNLQGLSVKDASKVLIPILTTPQEAENGN